MVDRGTVLSVSRQKGSWFLVEIEEYTGWIHGSSIKFGFPNREEEIAYPKTGVRIGMTREQVLDSNWGRPLSINRNTTARGTTEQWVYGNNQYLYFNNGVLTSISH